MIQWVSTGFHEVLSMRLWSLGFSFVLLLGGFVPCLAEQPTGPATLENLLDSGNAQKPAATADAATVDATAAGPKRPAGTVKA